LGGASAGIGPAPLQETPIMPRKPRQKPLTETDLVILRTAARRRGRRVLPWPKSLKAEAALRDKAISELIQRGLLAEAPAAKTSLAWRSDADGRGVTLTPTEAGVAALEPSVAPEPRPVATARRGTPAGGKGAAILALLQSEGGATIADLMAATGWQAHSIRGFLSGTVAKRLGHTVRSVQIEGEARRYRVEA
jgi:hypothetical protein